MKVLEKDINLKISKQVEKELKNKGYQVVMTREKIKCSQEKLPEIPKYRI